MKNLKVLAVMLLVGISAQMVLSTNAHAVAAAVACVGFIPRIGNYPATTFSGKMENNGGQMQCACSYAMSTAYITGTNMN